MINRGFCDWCGQSLQGTGPVVVAGGLICAACFGGTPRDHYAPASSGHIAITRSAQVGHDLLSDRPEGFDEPRQVYIVHERGVVREARPVIPAAPWVPQLHRTPRLDPRQLHRVRRGSLIIPPPPAAPAIPPQMPRSPRPDPRLLRHRVARSTTMPVSV